METLFHDVTFTRRQAGVFKICLASVGILLAIYFPKTLKKVEPLRWILFIIPAIYLIYIYFTQ